MVDRIRMQTYSSQGNSRTRKLQRSVNLDVSGSRKPGTIAECVGSRSRLKKPRESAASANTKFARTALAIQRQRIPTIRQAFQISLPLSLSLALQPNLFRDDQSITPAINFGYLPSDNSDNFYLRQKCIRKISWNVQDTFSEWSNDVRSLAASKERIEEPR